MKTTRRHLLLGAGATVSLTIQHVLTMTMGTDWDDQGIPPVRILRELILGSIF